MYLKSFLFVHVRHGELHQHIDSIVAQQIGRCFAKKSNYDNMSNIDSTPSSKVRWSTSSETQQGQHSSPQRQRQEKAPAAKTFGGNGWQWLDREWPTQTPVVEGNSQGGGHCSKAELDPMERWLSETMREEPYNNLAAVNVASVHGDTAK